MLRRLLCSDSSNPKDKQLPTREAILRDKNLARLGLHGVAQFPKPVLIEIAQVTAAIHALLAMTVRFDCEPTMLGNSENSSADSANVSMQDACILLECSDALKLCDAITPLQGTAALVPRLQRFVDDICSVSGCVLQLVGKGGWRHCSHASAHTHHYRIS